MIGWPDGGVFVSFGFLGGVDWLEKEEKDTQERGTARHGARPGCVMFRGAR